MQQTRQIFEEDYVPTDAEILLKTLNSKLEQQLVLTKVLDEHGKFFEYQYFDADIFAGNIEEFKSQRRIVDEYSESIFDLFLNLAKIKNQKEQQNNTLWIEGSSFRIRPDIFNASLSHVALGLIDQKLSELKSEDNPLFNLQYVNYTQRLNQNMMCIEKVELAKNASLKQKKAKPIEVWQQAIKNNTSVDRVVENVKVL